MIFQAIDQNLRLVLAVALIGMMAFSTSMAGSGGSESDGLFNVSPLPSGPAKWNVSVSCGAVPELTKGDLGNRKGPTAMLRGHPFERACLRNGIEHRLT